MRVRSPSKTPRKRGQVPSSKVIRVNEIPPVSSYGVPPDTANARELSYAPAVVPGQGIWAGLTTAPIKRRLSKLRPRPRPRGDRDVAQLRGEPPVFVTFWGLLTAAEQRAFVAVAHKYSFPQGALLMREGETLDRVFVILNGRTKVFVYENGEELTLAERGPGQLIGERAALELGMGSATAIALEPVNALVVPAEDFRIFLRTHPIVHSIVDDQIYGRLFDGQIPGRALLNGQNCTIVNTDIVGFGQSIRSDDHHRLIRQANLIMTLTAMGSIFDSCSMADRGDGLLMVVRPDIPTQRVIERLVNGLPRALQKHNGTYAEAARIQLRVAVDVGPVVSDVAGISGRAIIRTARMLDAHELKAAMADSGANLGIIVSEFVHDSAIMHTGDPGPYRQVHVNVKESNFAAWIALIN
jgi:hypothetical protein